jgi:hypothetical protein
MYEKMEKKNAGPFLFCARARAHTYGNRAGVERKKEEASIMSFLLWLPATTTMTAATTATAINNSARRA